MTLPFTRLVTKRNGQSNVYDRIIQVCLWLTVFFLPLFFLPVSTDPLEFNKAILFYVLVLIAGVVWLMKLVVRREGVFQGTAFDIPLAIFTLFSIVATLFSLYRYASLAGSGGYYSGSLVSLLFFLFFFYLVVNTVRREHVPKLLNALLLSGAVVVLFNFFQVFGLYLFPWNFTKFASFNGVVNSSAAFSVYLAMLTLLCAYRFLNFLQQNDHRPLERSLIALLGIVSFFLMLVYDQPIGWFVLMFGLLLYIVLLTAFSRHYSPVALITPTVVVGLSLVALFVNTQSLLGANVPGDVSLPTSIGWHVTLSVLKSNPLIGFGQETFQAVLGKFRPDAMNDSAVWNLRFLKSSNEWFQLIASIGLLGTLAFLAVCILAIRNFARSLLRTSIEDGLWWQRFTIYAIGLIFIVITFFLPFNFLLSFFLWFFLALSVVFWRDKEPAGGAVRRGAGTSFVASLGFSLAVVLGIVFLYFAGRFWVADMKVAQANQSVSKQEALDTVRQRFTDAISLNSYEQSTYFDLAQNLLVQAQLGAQKQNPDVNQLQSLITASIAAGQTGAQKFPKYAGSYDALSQLYQSVEALTGTTNDETKKAFTTAIDLEPNNPQLQMNLGQYDLAVAQRSTAQAAQKKGADGQPDAQLTKTAQDALDAAKSAFTQATKLKKNYIAAELNIALVLRLQGKGDEAVKMLEDLAAANPYQTDVLFNLSENYLVDKRTADAEAVLKRIVSIFPGHSDAHYRLAQIYQDQKETDKAIAELEIVQKINPDNTDIQKQLDDLKATKK